MIPNTYPTLNFDLGETADMIRETVASFAQNEIAPRAAEIDRTDTFPRDLLPKMGELGLLGITVEEEWGGTGLGYLEHVVAMEEISRASASVGLSYGAHSNLCVNQLRRWGNDDQKSRYLPKLVSGEHLGALAMSESGAGSDVVSMKLKAEKKGDRYVLNGTKRYITNANKADLFTVMARTDVDTPGPKGVSAFVVERNTPGVSVGVPEKKMGQQGAHICDVIFEDARVPAENIIGKEGEGFKVAMSVLDKGRLHISAVATGVSKRLIREMVNYALERKQFGTAIMNHQMIQAMIADSQAETYAAECMIMDAARRRDAGEDVTLLASSTKLFATEACGRVADRAVQVFGGAGYVSDYGIERFYRDVRIFRLYEGTSQIQQIIIARELAKAAKAGRL